MDQSELESLSNEALSVMTCEVVMNLPGGLFGSHVYLPATEPNDWQEVLETIDGAGLGEKFAEKLVRMAKHQEEAVEGLWYCSATSLWCLLNMSLRQRCIAAILACQD